MRMFVAKQGKETIKILFLNKGKKPLTAYEQPGRVERRKERSGEICHFVTLKDL